MATSYLFWFIVFSVAIFAVWIIYLLHWSEALTWLGLISDGDLSKIGQIGDGFGAATSLFSGLAFAGLLATLIMQRQELALQRKELENSTSEFMRQRFESTLFSILALFTKHIESLEYAFYDEEEPSQRLKGRAVLEYFASELPVEIESDEALLAEREGRVPVSFSPEQQALRYLQVYFAEFESDLGPYFRLLYNCVRHIEKSDLTPEEKSKYAKVVRAHLSSHEVKILMFNCNSHLGKDFREWVIKYRFLKHISAVVFQENVMLARSYPATAYGGSYPV